MSSRVVAFSLLVLCGMMESGACSSDGNGTPSGGEADDAGVTDAVARTDQADAEAPRDAAVIPREAATGGGRGDSSVLDSSAGDGAASNGWHVVFADEFDGPMGNAVDTTRWAFDQGGDGFGNGELERYTNRTDNAALDGAGHLAITVQREALGGNAYTSARLKTQGLHSFTYGRIEARMQIPRGQGIWPAFWMLGDDIATAGWPACGEIDVMENIGREPAVVHGTIHGPGYSGASGIGQTKTNAAPLANDFHVYAVEWEQNAIRWYLDDALYSTKTPADLPNGTRWVYDHPFFLIVNVAVGGAFPGNPDGTTQFPQVMLVDYVRVSQR